MQIRATSQSSFRFGPFVFDPRSGDLAGDGIACRLSDQPLALLTALLEQPGQLVTREQLRLRLWPDGTFVDFDHGLNSAVSRLREALHDSASAPRFVETVPRRGYRLLVPVEGAPDMTSATLEGSLPKGLEAAAERGPAPAPSQRWSRRFWIVGVGVVLAGTTWWLAMRSRTGKGAEPPPVRLLTVTSFPGAEGGPPALSPDGNFVVFNWTGPDFAADGDLWVKAVDGDALRRLTDTPRVNEVFPAWSPDGRQIAFTPNEPEKSGGIHVMSPLGDSDRKVTDSGWGATWLPDSRSFVFYDRAGGSVALFHYVVATGTRRQLTTPPAGLGDRDPKVSPDGKAVAFVRTTRTGAFGGAGMAALFVVPIDGGDPVRMDDWTGRVGHPEWTPDGREILYPRTDASGWRTYRVAVTGGQPASATGLPSGAYMISASGLRPGGTFRVALVDTRSDVGLRMIDLGRQPNASISTWTAFCDSTRLDWPGRFSRDGTQLAFTSDRTGTAQIYVASRDGSQARTVTAFDGNSVGLASWSPDGRSLVFDAVDRDNLIDLYVVGTHGGPPRRLTHDDKREVNPEWSRDGQWIYYEFHASRRPEIWKISAAGGQPVALMVQGGVDPRASPDGQSVYYLEPGSGNAFWEAATVKRVGLDGKNVSTVLSGVHLGRWDVTHGGILFLTGAPGLQPDPARPDVLEFYSFHDGRTRRLGELPFPVMSRGYSPPRVLAVSPDGRWVVVAHMDLWQRDIIVADNFR